MVLWLCGAILGIAAYQLPSELGPGAGSPLGWGLAVICAILALRVEALEAGAAPRKEPVPDA